MEELSDGEIVWVKVSNSWWPGEVMGAGRLPEGFLSSLRKKPLAVVKFFQEDTYEYVKNPSFIFKYNCSRKAEFLRKGMEKFNAKMKHMATFPEDVKYAERMTGGDPDIVNSTAILAQKKERYSGVFQESRTPTAKAKGNPKAGKSLNVSDTTPTTPARRPAHEVRILPQADSEHAEPPTVRHSETYRCYKCNFSANRQNLIVLHTKHCRATGAIDVATPTPTPSSSTPATAPIRSIAVNIQHPTDDATEEEETDPLAIVVSVSGRSKRSSNLATEHTPDGTTPKQTRGRGGRTPKQTGVTASAQRYTRGQVVKQENEEQLLADVEGTSSPKITGQPEAHEAAQQRRAEPEKESTSKQDPIMVEAPEKKNKTDVMLKNELLADWSEDEQEDDVGDKREAEPKSVEPSVVPTIETNAATTIKSGSSNDDEAVQQQLGVKSKASKNEMEGGPIKAPLVQSRVWKAESKTDKISGGEAEEKSATVDGKESKRDTVQDSSGPPVVVASASAVSVASPTTTVPPVISPCTTIKYRNIPKKQKREYIEVTNDDASPVPSREGSTASSSSTAGSNDSLGSGTVAPSSTTSAMPAAERPISAKQLILNRATRGSSGDETAAAIKVDDAVTVSQQASPESKKSPNEEASCFDFDDEEEGKQQGTTVQFSSLSPPSRRSGSLVDRKRLESGGQSSANEDTVVEASPETGTVAETEKQDEPDRDALLSQEIDSLLCETNVPKLPDDLGEVVAVAQSAVPSEKIDCNRTLPPKERGKRIFKTRNKSNAAIEADVVDDPEQSLTESIEPPIDSKPSSKLSVESERDDTTDNGVTPSEATSNDNDRQKPVARVKDDDSGGRSRRFENSDFATIKSKRTKYARKEREEENQIPSITSSEGSSGAATESASASSAAAAAAAADAKDVMETDGKKRKEELAAVVTTTDPGLAGTATSSLTVKHISTKGRRGKQKKTLTPALTDQLPVASQVVVVEKKSNDREQMEEKKASADVVLDVVQAVSGAKKKRKSSEPHLPDSSGAVERSQHALERKRGKKRKEASSPEEIVASGGSTAGQPVKESGVRSVHKTIVKEEATSASMVAASPAATTVATTAAAPVVGATSQSNAASITSKSINPRKRHLQSMLQSAEAVSTPKRGEAKVISTVGDTSTGAAPAPISAAPVAKLHETPSIPEKRKRDTATGGRSPSTTEKPQAQQASSRGPREDEKFDIDSMPIVIGDNNGMLGDEKEEVVMVVEQRKSLTDASSPVPPPGTTITVMKSVNGGGATSSAAAKAGGGLLSKTAKDKRHTIVTTLKGGSSSKDQIVITSKGTVLTTSSASVSVNSKLSAKPTVTVTSAVTICTDGRSACSTSATTTTSSIRRRSNPSEQSPESSSSSNGQQQQPAQPRVAEGANSSSVATKAPVAASIPSPSPSSSSTSSSSSSSNSAALSSSAPKKVLTKKLMHGTGAVMTSSTSSNKLLNEPPLVDSAAAAAAASAGDGASSSVSSSSSAGTSASGSGGAEGGKKNTRVMKVTPQKLKEFSRLGYIEDRGQGKVLTPSGMRKLKQELQNQQQQQQEKQQQQQQEEAAHGKKKTKPTLATKTVATNAVAGAAGSSSATRKVPVAEVASSGNVVVAAAADSSVQESSVVSDEAMAPEAHVEPGSGIPAVSVVEAPGGVSSMAPTAAVLIESSPNSISATEVILGTSELAAEASSSNGAGGGGGAGVQESSQLIAVPAENFGGPPSLFYLCSVRDESLVPVNNELLYLDSSNQLVALPEQQQQQQHTGQHQPGAAGGSAEDMINQAEVIIPAGNGGSEVAVGSNAVAVATAGGGESGSIVDAAVADGTQQSFLLNTQDGQQIILDQQSLMALAAGGDTPHLLTADGQQILLQETAQEWLAALSASQQGLGGQQQQGAAGTLGTLVTPEGTQIIVAHEHAGLIELQEHPVLLPTEIIQVNPSTTIETNAVLTKPPIMSTVEVPTKNGIESASGHLERKGSSATATTSRVAGADGGSCSGAILRGTTNLDESLAAVIGHVPNNPHVPTSLELPITVTNPAIAKTTTTSSRLNPPLFPVTTIATTVPSHSDVLSSAATVVLIATDQVTVAAAAGTIDRVPSPSSPPPPPPPRSSSPTPSHVLSAAKRQPTSEDDASIEREGQMLAHEKTRTELSSQQEPAVEEDVDDIQIPNTPESQQNSERQIEYSFSDTEEGADGSESNDHAAGEAGPGCPDAEDGNSNCSEVIALQPNVVIMDDGMLLANNVEDDGIDEEMDNENDSDAEEEEGAERRQQATVHNSQRRAAAGNDTTPRQPNRNANGSATGGREGEASAAERHLSNNNDSGIDTNMNAPANESEAAGYGGERLVVARRTIVER